MIKVNHTLNKINEAQAHILVNHTSVYTVTVYLYYFT